MRVLSRVELDANWDEAVALQQQFHIRSTRRPVEPAVPGTVMFEMDALPGVEAFDSAELALDSEADINPGMDTLQAEARAMAMPNLGHGTVRNGSALPSTSGSTAKTGWCARSSTTAASGPMPGGSHRLQGFHGHGGKPLSGDHAYTMHFTKEQLPAQYATHFWSVIAVDSVQRRVLPNALKRYLLNRESKLQYGADGSPMLYFADAQPKEAPHGNWLPTPKGQGYSLTFRFYRPRGDVAARMYVPPPLAVQ
ncbi:DUF1214 domain-containing protein [Variovorax humicola]|uniref:DUF1214 domain-containing protein n=1 Tax=Variovorax humicola TaxID=1769758 RepID=A0ABU8W2G9_9BURK